MPISKTQRMTWALLFLFLGGLWSGMIYTRCHRHSPTEIVTEQQSESMQKIRSPFVKWYHVFLFWFVVYLEVICAAFYVVVGIAVGRNYPFAQVATLSAFILDLIYKVLTAVYMNFCAIPIQHATQNRNVLEVLYTPDETLFSKIYAYLSGIKVYQPGGWIYGILYLGFLIYGIYFFSKVQFPLRSRKKVINQTNTWGEPVLRKWVILYRVSKVLHRKVSEERGILKCKKFMTVIILENLSIILLSVIRKFEM